MDYRDVTEAYLAERGKPWTQDQIAGDDMELKLNTPLQIPFHAPKGPDGEHPALTWINKHSPNGGNGANRGMFKMLRVYVVNLYVHAIKQIFGNPISSCLAAVLVLFLLVLLTCVV